MPPLFNLIISAFSPFCDSFGLSKCLSGKESFLPMQEMRLQTLGQEDSLEEEMATHSSILAWEIPWTEETGGL